MFMKSIESGSRVRIEFVIRFDNGSLVGTSDEKTVLTFNVGEGKMIKALEDQMYRHAQDLEFEEAAQIRDELRAIKEGVLVQ